MEAGFALPAPGLNPADLLSANAAAGRPHAAGNKTQMRAAAQDFEAVFLNSMFQQMFTNIDGEGPFGGGGGAGVWRSFLTQEYAKTVAKAGGVGIADQVYRSLLQIQEARS
jgi:Rod binding domain-containing protein